MIQTLVLLLDLFLAAMLLALSWFSVNTTDARRAVTLFIALGLLLALLWARLKAPDLALAEAAIGAGLTGALLLSALRDERETADGSSDSEGAARVRTRLIDLTLAPLTLLLALITAKALVHAEQTRLGDLAFANLAVTGVENPVTGVLLAFRAYDTLLELAVLLAAVLGIFALGPARSGVRPAGLLLRGLVHWLVPLLIVMAGYLLWVGAKEPGGAFQAGAILAGAAVLLRLGGRDGAGLPGAVLQRWLLVAGVGMFLAVGAATLMFGLAFLQYPPAWSAGLILLIETAATLSIALALTLAYLGGAPQGWYERADSPVSADAIKSERSQVKAAEAAP